MKKLGISIRTLASQLRTNKTYIKKILAGDMKPSSYNLRRIASALDIPMRDLQPGHKRKRRILNSPKDFIFFKSPYAPLIHRKRLHAANILPAFEKMYFSVENLRQIDEPREIGDNYYDYKLIFSHIALICTQNCESLYNFEQYVFDYQITIPLPASHRPFLSVFFRLSSLPENPISGKKRLPLGIVEIFSDIGFSFVWISIWRSKHLVIKCYSSRPGNGIPSISHLLNENVLWRIDNEYPLIPMRIKSQRRNQAERR